MRSSLPVRIFISIVVVQFVMLSLMLWNSIRVIDQNYSEFLEKTAEEQTTLLAAAVSPGLIAYDIAMIEDVLALAKKKKDLVYMEVTDFSGNRIASVGNYDVEKIIPHDEEFHLSHVDEVFDITRKIVVGDQEMGVMHVVYNTIFLNKIISEVRMQNTIIAGLTLLLLALSTIFISFLLTKKLRILKQGVREIQQGNLSHIIEMKDKGDFGELALAFNEMTSHLSNAHEQLREEHQVQARQTAHLKSLLNSVDAVIWESREDICDFIFVSREAEDLLGYPLSDWFEEGFFKKNVFQEDCPALLKQLELLKQPGRQVTVDVRMQHYNNKYLWTRFIASSDYDEHEECNMIRGLIIDISNEKRREEQIVYLAEHDALTGLVNRRYFQERLAHHISFGQRYGHESALLFLDLDQFKYINDTYGHQAGDAYLLQVAVSLKNCLRDTDILGRLGGDEFGVILPFADKAEAVKVAENVLASLSSAEWRHEEQQVHISASIGISLFPSDDKEPSQVLAEADAAMYLAKAQGRNRYHVYSKEDQGMARMQAKVEIENMIRYALNNDRVVLHYQPIFDFETGEISHHEALVRIVDAENNLIMPSSFIKTAERFGLIQEIDRWVFAKAVSVIAESIKAGSIIDVAINLSGKHIDDSEFHAWMHELLQNNTGVAEHIIIELTETAAVESLVTAKNFIDNMSRKGCRFALDDFGVGFSSFQYIKNLPVDYIKIDGSFVRNLHVDEADRVFVRAAVDIAKSMGIHTIAEFVENEKIMCVLKELGADYGQGYYLGRPDSLMSDKVISLQSCAVN